MTDQKPNHPSLILAIETSCDETALSILDINGLAIRSHRIHSQADLHAEFGGVFPNLAKREHSKNFLPLLQLVFKDVFSDSFDKSHLEKLPSQSADFTDTSLTEIAKNISSESSVKILKTLSREDNLGPELISYLNSIPAETFGEIRQNLHGICVTYGPGLEPALWVGISAAKALAIAFNLPLYPINHMEGHIASVLSTAGANVGSTVSENKSPAENSVESNKIEVQFPAIALLISGGHTELISIENWHAYSLIGKTVDDAVGEAYDKVARQLGLPYPGGPRVSALAEKYRQNKLNKQQENANPTQSPEELQEKIDEKFTLPRPMIHSKDLNFSFSGLKTAVLYTIKKITDNNSRELTEDEKIRLAYEFEEAAADVLIAKTKKAIIDSGSSSLLIGGGVIANTYLRKKFTELASELQIDLHIPEKDLTTDNASMIGLVAALQIRAEMPGIMPSAEAFEHIVANGNLSL